MTGLRPYESHPFREVTGATLRPGGFGVTERAMAVCAFKKGVRVLDVGCGLGATASMLFSRYGLKSFGLDASFLLLKDGLAQNSRPSTVGLAEALPFHENVFDGVFCECVLSLLPDPHQALDGFCQVLKAGGRLVIADLYARIPEGAAWLRAMTLNGCLKGIRSRMELIQWLEETGFQMLLWEDHSHVLKELAARIVFAYGSMKAFWAAFAPKCTMAPMDDALDQARPGYGLLVAQRN